jgi:endonuclease I
LDSYDYSYAIGETVILGCSAVDAVDGEVLCTYTGTVNNQVADDYNITYRAEDDSGNIATLPVTYTIYEPNDYLLWDLSTYYDAAEGKDGETLILSLNSIIDNHTVYPYTSSSIDVWDILRVLDEDPYNTNNIVGFYTGLSIPKDCQDGSTLTDICMIEAYGETKMVDWNREHIWSKSRGFPTESLDAYTDVHHLVATESVMNSTKNSRFFETCDINDTNVVDKGYGNYICNTWSFEPRDEVKGDTARMIFYMMTRYYLELDLRVIDDPMDFLISIGQTKDSDLPIYGDLADLIAWHYADPVSQKEIDRNNLIFSYQGNRNPFIDYPHFVELIYGDHAYFN